MKAIVIFLNVGLVALSVIGGTVLVATLRSNHELRDANIRQQAELQQLLRASEALRAGKSSAEEQLVSAQESLRALQAQLAEIDNRRTSDTPAADPPVVKPFQAPAYLGQTFLGMAWILPHNLRMDTNSQRYVYDPVIALSDSFRNSFVTYYTNIVEREVPTSYVNHNYYPQPVYWYAPADHHRSRKPGSPPTPTPPANPLRPAPTFDPGDGTTRPQRLGTPASEIKTRPQVLGTASNPPR